MLAWHNSLRLSRILIVVVVITSGGFFSSKLRCKVFFRIVLRYSLLNNA